jgi:hypothetical protein
MAQAVQCLPAGSIPSDQTPVPQTNQQQNKIAFKNKPQKIKK